MTSTNDFRKYSVIASSKKTWGKMISSDGIALPQCLLTSKIIVRELGAKRTKIYKFSVIPSFKTPELKLRAGAKALDESTIEVKAKNRNDEKDVQPVTIASGKEIWLESFRKPEGDPQAGDLLQVFAIQASCSPRANGDGYWINTNCEQVKVVKRSAAELLKTIRAFPETAFHLKNPRGQEVYRPGPILMNVRAQGQQTSDKAGSFNIFPEDQDKYRLFYQKEGEETKNIMLSNGKFGYHYIQWEGGEKPQHAYVDATLWSNHVAGAFGITNADLWCAVGAKFAQTLDGVFIGYADKGKTLDMEQNNEYYEPEGESDPDFGVIAKVTGFVSDPLANVQRAGYEVTAAFVKEKGLKNSVPVVGNPLNEDDATPVVNMSEMTKAAQGEVLAKEGVKYYFVCDTDIHEEDRAVLEGLDPEKTSAAFGLGKKKAPVNIRWKTGVVYAAMPPAKVGEKRGRE